MQAANDNLPDAVSGFDEWETLHEAARKVVEACAIKRANSHLRVVQGDHGETDVNDGGRHQAATLRSFKTGGSPVRRA